MTMIVTSVTTLANNLKSLAIYLRFIWFWAKFSTHFGTICMLSGTFSFTENGQILKTQFGHLVTLIVTNSSQQLSQKRRLWMLFPLRSSRTFFLLFRSSVTRCWNKKVAQIFTIVAQKLAQSSFYLKRCFSIFPRKVSEYLGCFVRKELSKIAQSGHTVQKCPFPPTS